MVKRFCSVCVSWLRVIADLMVMAVLFTLFLGLYSTARRGVGVRRGFFCDDSSIRHPFIESTVPSWALTLACLGLPVVTLIFGNLIERFITKRNEGVRPYFFPCSPSSTRCPIPMWLVRIGHQLRWFLVGMLVNLILTDIGKMVGGRLRPHFIAVCQPDFSAINCTDEFGHPVYVTNYTCTGDDEHRILDSRYSWPSGHSSLAAYSFVFLALYVASVRLPYRRSGVTLALMLLSFLLAMLTGLSRVSDYKHHPTDVLSGWLIGAAVAVGVVYYNLYFFSHYKSKGPVKLSNTNNTHVKLSQVKLSNTNNTTESDDEHDS